MYTHVVLGGTFDHFHLGHERLIEMALSLGRRVTIGLTSSDFVHVKEFSRSMQSFTQRRDGLRAFIKKKRREKDVTVIQIHDVFGTTLTDTSLEAIIVTGHTIVGAERINSERKKRGLPELAIHVCPFVHDDASEILSSTRVRAGAVNRKGFVYAKLFEQDIVIREEIAKQLHKPLGDVSAVLPAFDSVFPTILIGDIVTQSAIAANREFTCAYIDGQSHRAPYTFSISREYASVETALTNPHGRIACAAADHVAKHLSKIRNTIFRIHGEEDLLAVPAILLSPLGTHVLYGQPFGSEGVVNVSVGEDEKEFLRKLLSST